MGPPPHPACAACKLQRRKCTADCNLAPWFPPDQPKRFANVHKLFGVANVLKFFKGNKPRLMDLVKSIVYEADARERDPVHGAYGTLQLAQREANALELQRAKLQNMWEKMLQTEAQETAKQSLYVPSTRPQQVLNVGLSESSNLLPYMTFPGSGVYLGTQQQISIASGHSNQPEQHFVQYVPEQGYFYSGSALQLQQHSQMQVCGFPQQMHTQSGYTGNGVPYHYVNESGLDVEMPQSTRVKRTTMVENVNGEHPQYMRDFLSLRSNNDTGFRN